MENKTIDKLKAIIKTGYVPSRKFEPYTSASFLVVNCFAHACFNLTNKLLEEYEFDEQDGDLFDLNLQSSKSMKQKISPILKATGLDFCLYDGKTKLNKNQWKIALYISLENNWHFLLQEMSGIWSAKQGFYSNYVARYDKLPHFNNQIPDSPKIYLITNPYAESE